jgi:molybdopterin-containing oxidoreductase family membrane subunit
VSSADTATRAVSPSSGRSAGWGWRVWMIILGLLIAAGLATWIYQLTQGLQITHMRDNVIWGLYIITFMFFVGLSAGGLIVASAGRLFAGETFKPIVRLALVESAIAIFIAAIMIIPDLGHPQRVYNLIIHAHWLSPMIWDFLVIIIYLVISVVYLWLYTRRDHAARGSWMALGTKDSSAAARTSDEKVTYWYAWLALPAAILVHSFTAWIFGLQISRGFWYQAIMAPLFISSALVSGLALVLLLAMITRRRGKVSFEHGLLGSAGRLLAIFIAAQAFFVFCEVLAAYYPGVASDPSHQLLTGRYAAGFYFEVIGGLVVPFVLLLFARWRAHLSVIAVASVLALLGIFVHRANIIVIGLGHAPMQLAPGTPLGTPATDGSSFAVNSVYFPSGWEFLIVIGALALATMLFTLAIRYVPLEKSHET